MKRTSLLLMLLSLSNTALSDGYCEFTKQEIEFFEFAENYPFSDKDFSPESVTDSQKRLDADRLGQKVEYFIPDNDRNIIEGGRLQKLMLVAKSNFESYVPPDRTKWDRREHELKYEYLKTWKDYCDFRRSHYAIDW